MSAPSHRGVVRSGIAGGILAAGRAERLGVSKSFVRFESEYLIERAVKMFLNAAVENIIIAVRPCEVDSMRNIELLAQKERNGSLRYVFPESGSLLGASLQGLYGALQGRALVVHQVDRPFIPWQWVDHLCDRFEELGQIVASAYRGTLMPPVLLPAGLGEMIGTLSGDFGLRELLNNRKLHHCREEFDHFWESKVSEKSLSSVQMAEGLRSDPSALGFGFDCDTPADLRLLTRESAHVQQHGEADSGNKKERLPRN